MNKDEILSATDEQLNQWAAEKIRGWNRKHNQFSTPPDWWAVGNHGVVSIERYSPTTDIAQAVALLDHLRDTQGYEWELSTLAKDKPYMATVWWDGFCQFVCQEDDSRTRAIVIAALLAVAEIEQQTAAATDTAKEEG